MEFGGRFQVVEYLRVLYRIITPFSYDQTIYTLRHFCPLCEASTKSKTGFMTGKAKESIFKVPDNPESRVGVMNSGAQWTEGCVAMQDYRLGKMAFPSSWT